MTNWIAAAGLFGVLFLIGLEAYWWREQRREDRYFLLNGERTKKRDR